MKKLFAMAAFAAAMIFSACTGNKTSEEALNFEKATPEAVVNALAEKVQAGDATAITTALETVQTELSKLIDAGNVEKVTEYVAKIKTFVEENAEVLKGFNIDVTPLTAVFEQAKALPGSAEQAAQDAVEDAQDAAEEAVEGAVSEVEGAVNDAVNTANKAVNDAVDAGKKAANDAVDAANKTANKAVEDANKAVEDGKNKANQAIQDAADKLKL